LSVLAWNPRVPARVARVLEGTHQAVSLPPSQRQAEIGARPYFYRCAARTLDRVPTHRAIPASSHEPPRTDGQRPGYSISV
jgi:hypothetical protein